MNALLLYSILSLLAAPVTDDYKVMPHSPSLELTNAAVDISFTLSRTNGHSGLLSKDAYGYGDGGHLSIWAEEGIIRVRHQTTISSRTLSGVTPLLPGVTNQLRYVFDTDGMRLTLNGKLEAESAATPTLKGNVNPVVIGGLCMACGAGLADAVSSPVAGTIFKASILPALPALPEPPTPPVPADPDAAPDTLKDYFKGRFVGIRPGAAFTNAVFVVTKSGKSVTLSNAPPAIRAMRSNVMPSMPPPVLSTVDLRFQTAISVTGADFIPDTHKEIVTLIRRELEPFGGRIVKAQLLADGTIEHLTIDAALLHGLQALAESSGGSAAIGVTPALNDGDQNRFWQLDGEAVALHRSRARVQLATVYKTSKRRMIQYDNN